MNAADETCERFVQPKKTKCYAKDLSHLFILSR